MAVTKIKPIRTTIEKSIAYITNPGKTENCLFVSSEHCFPETAAVEFQFYLDRARAGGNTIGRHLIQSFAPDEVTPEQAHEIGKRLAGDILGGQYAYVLATHVDREHIHNHFVWCAVNIETHKKYRSTKASYHKIQEASDRLCAEYSLSVISEKSGRRGKSFSEYQADRQGASWKSLLRQSIDNCIGSADSFDDFLARMQTAGYEIKQGKYISFRASGQERFTRAKTIGDDYAETRIRERIAEAQKEASLPSPLSLSPQSVPEIRGIIDKNQDKIKSSAAYTQWTNINNIKASAETLNYLAAYCNGDVAEFERIYAGCLQKLRAAKARRDQKAKKLAASSQSGGITGYLRQFKAMELQQKDEYDALCAEKRRLDKIRRNILEMLGENTYREYSRSEAR